MASSASVSGLVSGLDTATIISQLMQVEAQPQTLLKSRLTSEQGVVGSLQGLNAKFAALTTKAYGLASTAAWNPLSATSSSDKVAVVAGSGAVPGTMSLTVQQTARAHQLSFATNAAGTDVVTAGSTSVRLDKLDGTTVDIDTGDGTLSGLVRAVNAAGAGVTASAVKLDDGSLRLRVVATATGKDSDFTLTNTDGSALLGGATVAAGQDAEIVVGQDTIHSASNTFVGLTEGLDVTLAAGTAAGTTVDLSVARDPGAASTALQGLVDAANDILGQIDKLTAYDAKTNSSSSLSGDPIVRELRTKVLDAVTRAADGATMADVGVQTDRYGKITFDATKFAATYATDPDLVAEKLGNPATAGVAGFSARLEAVGKLASDSVSGSLTTNIKMRQSSVTTMQQSIDDWDVRLSTKSNALNRQFAALEVALQKMQNQASWLSGQIASLPASSSSS